jgi:hypothetical protein
MRRIFFSHFRKFKILVIRLENFYSDISITCEKHRFSEHRGKLLFSALFNNAFSCLDYIASNDRMTMTWKGCGRKRFNLRYYPDICLDGLRRTNETSSYLIIEPRFEPGTFKILSRSSNHLIMMYGLEN